MKARIPAISCLFVSMLVCSHLKAETPPETPDQPALAQQDNSKAQAAATNNGNIQPNVAPKTPHQETKPSHPQNSHDTTATHQPTNLPDDAISILEYNEFENNNSYAYCSALPLDCKRVIENYHLKKRCLVDTNQCECLQNGTIVDCSEQVIIGDEGKEHIYSKIGDMFDGKGISQHKRKYTVITKPMTIKVLLQKEVKVKHEERSSVSYSYETVPDKTLNVDGIVREMCYVSRSKRSKCECHLIEDNCGNYVNKNGEMVYNQKYLDQEGKLIEDKLIEDGCHIQHRIKHKIDCLKPEISVSRFIN